MAQNNTTQFIVTETFRSENPQERKDLLQQIIDAYVSMKINL